ncbi:hypothetical protein BGZ76_001613 [Entomortierella beljakovae]|nr:hypothetical protein BGZ76_001613 [Entomortierella beljakovae]
MSLDHTESITPTDNLLTETVIPRRRKPTAENGPARIRREAIALDGQMFESLESGSLNGKNPSQEKQSIDNDEDNSTETASDNGKSENTTYDEANDIHTSRLSSSSASFLSSPTASSPDTSLPSELSAGSNFRNSELIAQSIGINMASSSSELAIPISRSLSHGNRQSMFLGDHIIISPDIPNVESPSSQSPNSNDDQEEMKEVQIETSDPSHLFWVPFHLHPEIAPNEYNRWLSKHGVDDTDSDGTLTRRKGSVSRRKSVLSTQYNPEDDRDEPPSMPKTIAEESRSQEFLSTLQTPLDQTDQLPLKSRTSLRRSVSLSVSSPTTSNDVRHSASRLRENTNVSGEHLPVSLVDLGPQPRPASVPDISLLEDTDATQRGGDTQPSKRFVSTLRDPSKPTITTYIEPHLLEQQRKENEDATKSSESPSSFRISAPAKLESPMTESPSVDTVESERKEKPDHYTVSYPIPPPVKLSQNLLQQPLAQQPSSPKTSPTQISGKQRNSSQEGAPTHAKKPSTWSWLWGKEKGSEKAADSLTPTINTSLPNTNKSVTSPSSQVSSTEASNQLLPSPDVSVKKQSTLAMLFSRNGKSSSSPSLKAQTIAAENTSAFNTVSGQSPSKDKQKYSNYNRLPIHIERAIYRLSHVKLANPRRPLHEQVLISNMMFWYLGVIQQQQLLQQQAEQQQLLQHIPNLKENMKASNSKDDLKEQKSKSKSKKRKSQKKKNQQSSSSSEKVVTSQEYEKQQQQQQQQQQQNAVQGKAKGQQSHNERDRPRSSSLDEPDQAHQLSRQQNGSQSDTLTTLSIKSSPRDTQIVGDEEDDDIPLAHYQNMPRQSVPVS